MVNFDPSKIDWSQLGAGGAQLLATILGNNPGNAANDWLNQSKKDLYPNFQPWIQAGQQALPDWQKQLQLLTQNPGQFINQVGNNYKQSPGLQFQIQQGTQSANNAAAAGGMAGSPQAQQYASTISNNLANKDYYNYLSTALGQYDLGLKGLQDLSNQGQQAAQAYGEDYSSILDAQAKLAYESAKSQNQGMGAGFGSIVSGLLSAIGL